MNDLIPEEMLERIKRSLAETSASFGRKIIVHEGLNRAWGALREDLFETLQAQVCAMQPGNPFAYSMNSPCGSTPPAAYAEARRAYPGYYGWLCS